MNVYVDQTCRALAAAGHRIDVFTADPSTARDGAGTIEVAENYRVHHLGVRAESKDELADASEELSTALDAHPAFASAELIWAHYWISAEVALKSRARSHVRTQPRNTAGDHRVPVIVSMHTIGAVKNRDSDTKHEGSRRLEAEADIARTADLLVANTPAERRDLIHELGADPEAVVVARPGVDHSIFTPGDQSEARERLGLSTSQHLVLYVGRMQFIKGTDVVVDTLDCLRENNPELAARTRGILMGAASQQSSAAQSSEYLRDLAVAVDAAQGLDVREPVPAHELVDYYRAADVLLVPSRSESFGLVAAEAAASGLPAIASAVGGLPDIIEHGCSGILIPDHNPRHWALALESILCDRQLRDRLAARAIELSARFDWSVTVSKVLDAVVPKAAIAKVS